ncbi:MAG TPA: hypothetical protein VFU90_05395, partial [Candidatus Tumulicola sp.]|nr:hypothetical protein [Candidatus Tumulicola sp.]
GRHHRNRRNVVRPDYERNEKERDQAGRQQRVEIFADGRRRGRPPRDGCKWFGRERDARDGEKAEEAE